MRIADVSTTLFRDGPAPGSVAGSPGIVRCLVELTTDEGLHGMAIAPAASAPAVAQLARDALIGANPQSAMGLWEHMCAADGAGGLSLARAALDVAVWDLKARACGEPLWKTLGGSPPRAIAHLHRDAGDGADDGADLHDWYRTAAAATGLRSASLPASPGPMIDLERLADLKQAICATVPQAALMVHFDGTGWPGEVIRHVRALESGFDLAWVRTPVRAGDFRGARQVADGIAAAVCIGAGFDSPAAFLPYLEDRAANVLELDVTTLGISGCVQMADAAFGFELPVALGPSPGHLGVQLFSAFPTSMSVAIDRIAGESQVIGSTVTFDAGRAIAGLGPGNGLVVDRAALDAARHAGGER